MPVAALHGGYCYAAAAGGADEVAVPQIQSRVGNPAGVGREIYQVSRFQGIDRNFSPGAVLLVGAPRKENPFPIEYILNESGAIKAFRRGAAKLVGHAHIFLCFFGDGFDRPGNRAGFVPSHGGIIDAGEGSIFLHGFHGTLRHRFAHQRFIGRRAYHAVHIQMFLGLEFLHCCGRSTSEFPICLHFITGARKTALDISDFLTL